MQYPPAPRYNWVKLAKLHDPSAAWEDLSRNIIPDGKDLLEKLRHGYFDLVLLLDYDARLFRYSAMGMLSRARNWLGQWKHLFQHSISDILADIEYMHGIPLPLVDINSRIPVAAIDLNDWICLTPADQQILQNCSFYFKRELPFNRYFLYYQKRPAPWSAWRKKLAPVLEKVQNIPLGIEDEKYSALKQQRRETKDIDVFFCGEVTSTQRLNALKALREMASKSEFNIVIDEKLSFEEYCNKIARSKITLSISGGGWDCFRHYEAVALGSLPFMDCPTVDTVWWRELPSEIFFENTFVNFRERLGNLLQDDHRRQNFLEIVEKTVENKMLHSKIVEFIVSECLQKKRNFSASTVYKILHP